MSRLRDKLRCHQDFAIKLAGLSTCKRAQVGCVIVTPTLSEVLAIGYNGPPSGSPNDGCREIPGQCGCIHAEANALIKLREVTGAVMLTSTFPCEHCAGLIVNSRKITHVLYWTDYRCGEGLKVLANGSVFIRHIGQMTDDQLREWWPASYKS